MKISFLNLLTANFITLKLTHYIDWAWIWVLMPTIVWGFVISVFMGMLLIVAIINDL